MKKFYFDVSKIPSSVPEAVMGAFVLSLPDRNVAILFGNGKGYYISLADYSEVNPNSSEGGPEGVAPTQYIESEKSYFSSRNEIAKYLNTSTSLNINKLGISVPLYGSEILKQNTNMFRFTASKDDICYDSEKLELRKNTYLAPMLDVVNVTTGYRAVGRYSLPFPAPARYQHEYIIPANTHIHVGTVEPQFGQSGGGVEVRLDDITKVKHIYTKVNTDY